MESTIMKLIALVLLLHEVNFKYNIAKIPL